MRVMRLEKLLNFSVRNKVKSCMQRVFFPGGTRLPINSIASHWLSLFNKYATRQKLHEKRTLKLSQNDWLFSILNFSLANNNFFTVDPKKTRHFKIKISKLIKKWALEKSRTWEINFYWVFFWVGKSPKFEFEDVSNCNHQTLFNKQSPNALEERFISLIYFSSNK